MSGILAGSGIEMTLNDATPMTLGISEDFEIKKGFLASLFGSTEYSAKMTPIIQRNSTVPTSNSKDIQPKKNATSFTVTVLEGEEEAAQNNYVLTQFEVKGLHPKAGITVKFDIDADSTLTVTATNIKTGADVMQAVDQNKLNLPKQLIAQLRQKAKSIQIVATN